MIITSLLDTDLYKFTMMQVVLHQFPGAQVEYRFKCRNSGMNLAAHVDEIREEIRSLCSLHFQDSELAYLRSLRFVKSDFVDFLGLFKLNEKYITVTPMPGGDIDIAIVGPWLHTILFEIPVLAIVNEVYFRNTQTVPDFVEGRKRLDVKIGQLRGEGLIDLKIADYGTRRRFSRAWHEEVIRVLSARLGTSHSPGHSHSVPGQFAGTSNVWLAMKLGLTPLGTMAHEYLQASQALGPRLRDSQIYAFESWAKEYRETGARQSRRAAERGACQRGQCLVQQAVLIGGHSSCPTLSRRRFCPTARTGRSPSLRRHRRRLPAAQLSRRPRSSSAAPKPPRVL